MIKERLDPSEQDILKITDKYLHVCSNDILIQSDILNYLESCL